MRDLILQLSKSSIYSTKPFEAREFLETGDEAARLAGNAPFIIDKDSGEIHSLGTAKPLEEYLQDYEIKKATFGLP
ncbi:YrhB domain-containing protein [Escherichia coli]|uniref:YrhB domain-containing protein n=1 Tax=Escherichia coli TaxID=562 RepID=UPI0023F628DB|nr:YrhB domain-containing protein [Escherichia coli]MDF7548990.1 YrhB family protein [Escherichia coli]